MEEFKRAFSNAKKFYMERLKLIVIFSIPFFAAYLLVKIVAAPTFLSFGTAVLRTGSIPELSIFDVVLAVVSYLISFYIIAVSIVNVNLVVLSKRTLNQIRNEVSKAMGSYALTIFYVYTIMLLLIFVVNLLTYDNAFRTWIYPLVTLVLSYVLFFVPPAVVIDHAGTMESVKRSLRMALGKPHVILLWSIFAFIILAVVKILADLIFGSFAGDVVLLINSLFILPFLIILQTQLYMEKYPIAKSIAQPR